MIFAQLTLAALSAISTPTVRGDEPPPGLPWVRTYDEAKREALTHGRPVFIYFTKTY